MRPVTLLVLTLLLAMTPIRGIAAEEISVERGLQVSIIGGCHDCHTAGYVEAEGKIDPAKAFKGSAVGWRGPWGTTYALNLRLTANTLSESGFVLNMKSLKTLPPMPWFNVRAMSESDLASLYRYIKSLGDPGVQPAQFARPDEEPTTPFVVLVPPQMPKACRRDLDCGIGQICKISEAGAQCVAR
jgi:mono/diheme cytochrome c family protein